MGQDISLKSESKTHDLNHDLTFSAHTINCMCHSIRSMFRVLGVYNFEHHLKKVGKWRQIISKVFVYVVCRVVAPIILESQSTCKGPPKKSNVWQSSAIRCKVFVSRIARTRALARTQVQNGCTRLF